MMTLVEYKASFKKIVSELHERFDNTDAKVFSDTSSKFTTRNAYIIKNEDDANFLRQKAFELAQIEEKCKELSGSNKNGLKAPKVFDNARRLRIWINDSTTVAPEPHSKETLIKRVRQQIEKAGKLSNAALKQATLDKLSAELEFFEAEIEDSYYAVFRGNTVVKAHAYLTNSTVVNRFNISEAGVFMIPSELADFDLKISTDKPDINSIYDRLEPIPCDTGMICQFYRKSEVERIKLEQKVDDETCKEKARDNVEH